MSYYAVRKGKTPGVYETWNEAKLHIEGFKGAIHKKFKTRSEAYDFVSTQGDYRAPITLNSASLTLDHPTPAFAPIKNQLFARSVPISKSISTNGDLLATAARNSVDMSARKATSFATSGESASDVTFDLIIYTDGACKGNSNVQVCPAGWGVVVLTNSYNIIDEIYAPVELCPTSPYFLGASVGSNNTAELTAIGEALIWLRDSSEKICCDCSINSSRTRCSVSSCICPKVSVSIRYDSEYAAKSVMGVFNGDKNKQLYTRIREIYKSVQKGGLCNCGKHIDQLRKPADIVFQKVKGHSGDTWNDKADNLANKGARGLTAQAGRYDVCSYSLRNINSDKRNFQEAIDLCGDDDDEVTTLSKKQRY